MTTTENTADQYLLLFDEDCSYCVKFSGLVRQFDREGLVRPKSLQKHSSEDSSIPLETLLEEIHLLGPDRKIYRGAEAIQMIISLIPQARAFRWLIDSGWGRKGSELLYAAMKKFRPCEGCGSRN